MTVLLPASLATLCAWAALCTGGDGAQGPAPLFWMGFFVFAVVAMV